MRWYVRLSLLMFALGVLGLMATQSPSGSGEWASWVQAIGSILAILISILIVNQQSISQSNNSYADELRNETLRFEHLRAIFLHLLNGAEIELDRTKGNDALEFDLAPFEITLNRLQSISAFEIPNAGLSSKAHLCMSHIARSLKAGASANALIPIRMEFMDDPSWIHFHTHEIMYWQNYRSDIRHHMEAMRSVSMRAIDECDQITNARHASLKHLASNPFKLARH